MLNTLLLHSPGNDLLCYGSRVENVQKCGREAFSTLSCVEKGNVTLLKDPDEHSEQENAPSSFLSPLRSQLFYRSTEPFLRPSYLKAGPIEYC